MGVRQWMVLFAAIGSLGLAGCGDARPDSANSDTDRSVSPSSHFDARSTGTVSGRVTWEGALPAAPLFEMRTDPSTAPGKRRPTPNLPDVDLRSRAVRNAVVFLRGIDSAGAKPWDHPPVRVELRDLAIHVVQGETDSRVGIVRAGDEVPMVSREPLFHALEARGAAFFSLRFVEPERIASRRLDQKGVVELRSASGYFWMRGHLLVDDHPYYARTDSEGRFRLGQVPPGRYQAVCWMPNWNIARRERDPESGLVTRLLFAPPLEIERTVVVQSNQEQGLDFAIAQEMFAR